MNLRQARCKASQCWELLIHRAFELGYEAAIDDVKHKAQKCAYCGQPVPTGHMPLSLHEDALAMDLNLYKDGRYVVDDEGHKDLGVYWKSLHPDCRWGGDFDSKDFNHYAFAPPEIVGNRK